MEPEVSGKNSYDQMAIVEKYERVVAYLYPIAQSIPRKHGVARDLFLQRLLSIPDLIYQAGKSSQASRLYFADAALAELRFWLRFLTTIRSLTAHQLQVSQVLLAEVGSMLGAWIRKQGAQKGRIG